MARNRITGRETQKMQEYTQERIAQAERRDIEFPTDVKEQIFEYANLIGEEEKVRTSEVEEQFEYMYRLFFFLFLGVKTVMFFLCTVEHHSIIKPVFLHKFKSYNKEIGKPDESLGRKATGPLKWQPVA